MIRVQTTNMHQVSSLAMPSYPREPGQLAQRQHPCLQSVAPGWLMASSTRKGNASPEMLLILLTLAANLVASDHGVLESS